jgi:hypothetical protein
MGDVIADLGTRMIQLTDEVLSHRSEIEKWLEAERQLGIYYVESSLAALEHAGKVTPERHYELVSPYLKWTSEFGHNLRYWRRGKLTADEMLNQAARIENLLRAKDAWRASALPWRTDLTQD